MGTAYLEADRPNLDLRIRGGCIRLGNGGPLMYNVDNHSSLGLKRVWEEAGDLKVETDWSPGEELISAVAVTDLQLGVKRISLGVSGGGAISTIRLTRPDGTRVTPSSAYFNNLLDNIWFQTVSVKVIPPPPPEPPPG